MVLLFGYSWFFGECAFLGAWWKVLVMPVVIVLVMVGVMVAVNSGVVFELMVWVGG